MEEIEDEFYCGESEKEVKKFNFTEEYKRLMKNLTNFSPSDVKSRDDSNDCSICFRPLDVKHPKDSRDTNWKYGNNAAPFEGRCCDVCDCLIVIPARMGLIQQSSVGLGKTMLEARLSPPSLED